MAEPRPVPRRGDRRNQVDPVSGTEAAPHDWGRRDLVAAVYDRIVVTSEGFVSARLTEDALVHGMAWALPEVVAGARPEGDGHPRATTRIPIEGAGHWRRALRTA